MRRTILALAALFSLAVAAPASDVDELKATFEQAVKALNDRNLDGFLATVHDKGLSFYSCGPTSGLEGKAACQQDWQKFFTKTGNATFTPQDFQYRVIGNTGIAWGKYTVTFKSSQGPDRNISGRYHLVYTKVAGKWMVVLQENTPDPPAVPGAVTSASGTR